MQATRFNHNSFKQSIMSAALVRDFFPTLTTMAEAHPLIHHAWTQIFPPSVEQICPRPSISLQISPHISFTLMWPLASFACLLGILIGLSHGPFLLYNSFANPAAARGCFTWGFAFLWYAVMSLGGLFYHCIIPWRVFYFLDVASTACSGISIVAGYHVFTSVDDRDSRWRTAMLLCYLVIGILTVGGPQMVPELLYLSSTVLAFTWGIWLVQKVYRGRYWAAKGWLNCAVGAAMVAILSALLDGWLCRNLGSNGSVLLWFFLGCDGAILCVYRFVSTAAEPHLSSIKSKAS